MLLKSRFGEAKQDKEDPIMRKDFLNTCGCVGLTHTDGGCIFLGITPTSSAVLGDGRLLPVLGYREPPMNYGRYWTAGSVSQR